MSDKVQDNCFEKLSLILPESCNDIEKVNRLVILIDPCLNPHNQFKDRSNVILINKNDIEHA